MTDTNYKYEVGKWYKTRNGWDAKILDDNFKGSNGETFVVKVRLDTGEEFIRSWQSDGRWLKDQQSEYDLMPPVETKEYWVNVYDDYLSCGYASNSRADEFASNGRIGLLKLTITGDEYTVEKVKL